MNFYDLFDNIYVINLEKCTGRKKGIIDEFRRVGINDYEFFPGVDKNSSQVTHMINSHNVIDFPACFRCKKNICSCPNNCITRPQIGNWLAFLNVWKDIVDNRYKFVIICEDDIRFAPYANRVLNKDIIKQISNLKKESAPVLIRLGWAKCNEHKFRKPILKAGHERMANSFHCINFAMAKLLLDNFTQIYHTSDVYIHRDIPKKFSDVKAFTLLPPLTYGLSSAGEIDSTIHTREDPFYVKRLNFKRFLFVSAPQSGLLNIVSFLKDNNLAISHESMSKDGIASWMLAVDDINYPFGTVGMGKRDGLIMGYYFHNIIHIITSPKDTIPYILLEISKSKKAFNFMRKHLHIPNKPDLETACNIFLRWNELIKKKMPKYTIRADVPNDIATLSRIFKLNNKRIDIDRKVVFKRTKYPVPDISLNEYCKLSDNIRLKLDKFCVEHSYPRFVNLNKRYKIIDLLIIGPGGVGCSYFLDKANDESKLRINKKGDMDRLKHMPSPSRIKPQIIVKKALFIFNDPLLAVKSHFRRKWHMCQISKLGNPNKFNTKQNLSYSAYCNVVEERCCDVFGIEYQYDNWINEKKDFPVMFVHFPNIKDNAKIISRFTGLNKQFFDTFEIQNRKSKEGNESELVKKVYEDLYNKMLDKGEYYIA